ncbi:MAG: ribonuclease HII [Epsilonproteobacteria bacterium]|nr:ribonuclease HII [Campylobacterota bacterium]
MGICGIDEAGRGPIAGPLVVAGVKLTSPIDGLDDSKRLTPKKRELLFDEIVNNSIYEVVFVDNVTIDKKGLSYAIGFALAQIKAKIQACRYIFDGNCNFGVDLETMVKGDTKVAQISAASIIAKVSRDRFMCEIAKNYPNYNFCKHKGYITKAHIEEIRKFGFSDIHRKSYKLKSLYKQNTLL